MSYDKSRLSVSLGRRNIFNKSAYAKPHNAHTRHYHFKYRTSGHVWQGRFQSPIISDDDYLITVMQYIEQNSLRACMVNRLQDYPWTSYALNSRLKISKFINRNENPAFKKLGENDLERSTQYRKKIKEDISKK